MVGFVKQAQAALFIGVGAFFGANLRYFVTLYFAERASQRLNFPVGTLFANVTGSLLLATVVVLVEARFSVPPNYRLMILTGFFGSYTTFSTFANESVGLWERGGWTLAAVNVVGTNALCLLGVLVGIWLGEQILLGMSR